ncbi:MAG: polysaccharide biosynthesis/export family protein [Muribaculaceae bacterium]|nr:polysaccharide biosynthesis/export family protein [Muribaculaceae bacterium]
MADPILAVGDLLNIEVTGPNMAAVAPFNRGTFVDPEGHIQSLSKTNSNIYQTTGLEVSTDYYLVNADGCIDFPVIGKISVAGKTKSEVAAIITNEIYPKYVTDRPAVDIRLMNFRVTVAGAVKSPGMYQSKNERMTFLEAITMAGDLDIKGDRENILLYRVNTDGTREVHRINIHDKNFLLSPYFTLQQNDYIYVQPNKSMRQNAWQMNPAVSATISVVGGMSSLASLVIGIVNLSK